MKINLTDFNFKPVAYGCWLVTYTSPITGKIWTRITSNQAIIDLTKNTENPKQKHLRRLERITKSKTII